ncbi:MAG: class I SAM-dependent methyltransferase [Chloroflexi bacterium]|nr:class I SAM-dependent methyltransferase [Chloroflexota bacterium]
MNNTTRQILLDLNRAFYATVAQDFDQTRAGLPVGWHRLQPYLSGGTPEKPMTILDAGCGNGRFARALETYGASACYVGVDADAALLAFAAEQTRDLAHVQSHFFQGDLSAPGWSDNLNKSSPCEGAMPSLFDAIVCFAALHHFPSYDLRLQIVKELAALSTDGGVLIFSNWQFLTSARFVQKQIAWQTVGLTEMDVELGDALLPWQQGGYAVRYVHQLDEAEMQRLAIDAQLEIVANFYADGKEGNLNLYTVLKNRDTG